VKHPRWDTREWAVTGIGLLAGVGAGITMVPLLTALVAFSQHPAHATGWLPLPPQKGYASLKHAAVLAGGGVGGAYAGATLALSLSAGSLQVAFGALMAYSGIRTIYRGLRELRAEKARPADKSRDGEPAHVATEEAPSAPRTR
jgi:uncharacterized membrane protein YfcA